MTALSEKIKQSSQQNNSNNSSLKISQCPDFIWVVRDYALKTTTTPKQRLEIFLKPESTTNVTNTNKINQINQNNSIKECLRNSFNEFDCYTLSCPVTDGTNGMSLENALQSLNQIKWDDLRDKFKTEMDQLCEVIRTRIKPKLINSIEINGAVLAAYIKKLVDCINSQKTIFICESLSASIKLVAFESLKIIQEEYLTVMSKKKLPCHPNEFQQVEKNARNDGIQKLKDSVIDNGPIYEESLKSFHNFCDKELTTLKDKNKKSIYDFNFELAKSIWNEKMEPKIASFKYQYEFDNFIAVLKNEFYNKRILNYSGEPDEWLKFIETKNVEKIGKDIENKRIKEEKIKNLEKEKAEAERKLKEEAEKRAQAEQKAREIEYQKSSSSYSSYLFPSYSHYPDIACSRAPSPARSFTSSSQSSGPRCKDGTLDMRYKENRGRDKYYD